MLRIRGGKLGEDLGDGRVGLVQALEVQERVQERAPLALRDAHGEEEHDLEIRGARGHDALAVQVVRHERRRNAVLPDRAVVAHAGREDADLDRVEHDPVFLQAGEPVPGRAVFDAPAALVGREKLARGVGKGVGLSGLEVRDRVGVPRFEEPAAVLFRLAADARERLPEVDRLLNHLLRERAPAARHHGG